MGVIIVCGNRSNVGIDTVTLTFKVEITIFLCMKGTTEF
jgi:hypothetical protein